MFANLQEIVRICEKKSKSLRKEDKCLFAGALDFFFITNISAKRFDFRKNAKRQFPFQPYGNVLEKLNNMLTQ